MDTTIWIIQGVLAAFFLIPGILKTFFSKKKLIAIHLLEPGASVMPQRFIGIAELMGSVGIIVPLMTGIMPILTPIAASGLSLIMAGAILFVVKRKEHKKLPLLAIVLLLCAVVAWFRF